MANDINKAIASGGYVIVTEKAVDGAGRNAIYVYMTYNAQDGYQTWKISGGLNGAILLLLTVIILPFFAMFLAASIASAGAFTTATFLGVGSSFLLNLTNLSIGILNATLLLDTLDCGSGLIGLGLIALSVGLAFIPGVGPFIATIFSLSTLVFPAICENKYSP